MKCSVYIAISVDGFITKQDGGDSVLDYAGLQLRIKFRERRGGSGLEDNCEVAGTIQTTASNGGLNLY